MAGSFDARYSLVEAVTKRTDRECWKATDRLYNRTVFLKKSHRRAVLDEALILLALPPRVSPCPIDLFADPDPEWAWLVLPWMNGETLAQRLQRNGPSDDPRILLGIAGQLEELHHRGFVHVDLKPGNVFLCSEGCDVQLIDFGMAKTPFFRLTNEHLGGTQPYVAPEVARGWSVGPSADVYALGKIIDIAFHSWVESVGLGAWVDSLTQTSARNRPTSAEVVMTLGQHVSGRHDTENTPLRFGGGSFFGRESDLKAVADTLSNPKYGRRVLVHSRRGAGLSRFGVELQAYVDQRGQPIPRVVEFGPEAPWNSRVSQVSEVFDALVSHTQSLGMPLIVSVPDHSPGLFASAAPLRHSLEKTFGRGSRFLLDPVEPDAFVAGAVGALGAGGPQTTELGHALWSQTEGNWHRAQEILRLCGPYRGLGKVVDWTTQDDPGSWSLEDPRFELADSSWTTQLTAEVDAPEVETLLQSAALCAQLGRRFPTAAAIAILSRFDGLDSELLAEDTVSSLIDRGLLRREDDALEFRSQLERRSVSQRLDSERLLSRSSSSPDDVTRWALSHARPDGSRIEDTIEYLTRAAELGETEDEHRHFSECMQDAFDKRNMSALCALAEYAGGQPLPWNVETTVDLVANIAREYELDEAWIAHAIALGMRQSNPAAAAALWNHIVSQHGGQPAADALVWLMNAATTDEEFSGYHEKLVSLEAVDARPAPGSVDTCLTGLRIRQGRHQEAYDLAKKAVEESDPTQSEFLDLSYLYLAIASTSLGLENPAPLLQRAVALAPNPARRATILYNKALIHSLHCELDELLETCRLGVSAAAGRGTAHLHHVLRQQLAWALFFLDRVDDCRIAAQSLERYGHEQRQPEITRTTLGMCALYDGDFPSALRAFYEALEIAADRQHPGSVTVCLGHLVNALLDTEDFDNLPDLVLQDSVAPIAAVTQARWQALREHARGRRETALAALRAVESDSVDLPPSDRADYHYAVGWMELMTVFARTPQSGKGYSDSHSGEGPRSVEFIGRSAKLQFARTLAALPQDHYGYHVLRARIGLGLATAAEGDIVSGLQQVVESTETARAIDCKVALVLGLRARRRIELLGDLTARTTGEE